MEFVRVIPALTPRGELPPGEFTVSLVEIEHVFGQATPQRQKLMAGLKAAVAAFAEAGVHRLWVNGSFATSKPEPNDIDGCWEYTAEVDLDRLDPVFLAPSRQPMKTKYGLEFFPAQFVEAGCGLPFPRFFQTNRDGDPKGILLLNIHAGERA
jgi:hypothetical protein